MRFIPAIASLCVLTAAGAGVAQESAAPSVLVVIDLRPDEERSGHGLMPLRGKCNKDVFRIADVATDPGKIAVFTEDLRSALGEAGSGKTLTILNWSIYYNKQVQGGGSALRGVGIGGYNFPTGKDERKPGSDCAREESAGGWYDAGELQSNYFPLVSEFEGTFAGKPVSVRVVHSPRRKIPGKFAGDEADTATLLEAIHATAEAVATEIAR